MFSELDQHLLRDFSGHIFRDFRKIIVKNDPFFGKSSDLQVMSTGFDKDAQIPEVSVVPGCCTSLRSQHTDVSQHEGAINVSGPGLGEILR
jgi:hypothetical protein